jgi:dolichol-phosphate mannosyltransferase
MKKLSITIPIHNELPNIPLVHKAIRDVFANLRYDYEIIFIDDGSTDGSQDMVNHLMLSDSHVSLIEFSRNFGKEAATSAGFHHATGDAVICIDADLQHPPHLIPDFIKAWEDGFEVVIGVRTNNASDSKIKKIGSHLYYKIINKISRIHIIPKATDFRLVDRVVVDEFNRLSEHNRMTRGLIDWLGFRRHTIHFEAPERMHGEASYSVWKLAKLAVESIIASSLTPLRLAGYLGTLIVIASLSLGTLMILDRFFVDWGYNFSGPAILADIILFLVGIVIVSLGLIAYYIGHIYHDVQDRPLYVVRKRKE